jgi:hypothetical protein
VARKTLTKIKLGIVATYLQKYVRGFLAKRLLKKLKREKEAALII